MSAQVGRAGFHVVHTKAISERVAILDEMMRELSDESIARWATRNSNIVVEDEHLNIALVNGGEGDLVPCEDPKEVLAYGQERIAKLSTRVKQPKHDPATGKEKGGMWTSSMFALHLPKSLCREVEDFYPVLDDDGNEVGRRSRWVARDRDEALRYFEDAMEYMASQVIPGGWDAILGADIQFSESTPHIQVLADPFAPDPKHPGQLRTDFSRAYGSHRGVRDEKGRQMSGRAKLRRYHDGLKQYMIERGWEVEREVDSLRHETGHSKAVYAEMQDAERAFRQRRRDFDDDISKRRTELNEIRAEIATERENLDAQRTALDEDARRVDLARKQVEQKRQALDDARTATERERRQASEQQDRARALVNDAALHLRSVEETPPLDVEQGRRLFRDGVQLLADDLKKRTKDPSLLDLIEKRSKAYVNYAGAPKFADYIHESATLTAPVRERQVSRQQSEQRRLSRRVVELNETTSTTSQHEDDGLSL